MEAILEMYPISPDLRTALVDNGIKVVNYDSEERYDYEEITAIYTHYNLRNILLERCVNVKYILCPCTSILDWKWCIPESFKGEIIYLDDSDFLYKHVRSTAEHTMRLMLDLCYKLKKELSKKRVGLIGYGRVAQQVTELLQGFNCRVSFYDPDPGIYDRNYRDENVVASRVDDINDIFADSDIVSLHITDSEENHNFIKYEHFIQHPKHPIMFINTARAHLVDPEGLLNAYLEHYIEGFAIDEIDTYDYRPKDLIQKYARIKDDVIVTNHTAGQSKESRRATDFYVIREWCERENIELSGGVKNDKKTID